MSNLRIYILNIFLIVIFIIPFSIIIIIVYMFHKLIEKPPFLFIQKRVGINKKDLSIIKIKTMEENKISRFSNFLRKTKLDEIPQFISIIIGDLNFIGPRPLLKEYNNFYKKSEELRFSVKPGITGLSQIKSTSSTNWDTRLRWDIIYVKRQSFKLDMYIFFSTIRLIFINFFNKKNEFDNFERLDEVRKNNG